MVLHPAIADERLEFLAFANECQVAVGTYSTSPTFRSGDVFRKLAAIIPAPRNRDEQVRLRILLAKVCLGLRLRAGGSDQFAAAISELLDLNSADLQGSFRRALEHSTDLGDDSARHEFERDFAAGSLIHDVRIAAALRRMRAEHKNPNLRLGDIAKMVGLSTSHLHRLLLRDTHQGFLDNLRAIRIGTAARLLANTTLSVKEVAFEVGYKHVSELDRHFRLMYGMSPSLWRRRRLERSDC
jgi:AraC-like DNA-binding protein